MPRFYFGDLNVAFFQIGNSDLGGIASLRFAKMHYEGCI